MKNENETPDAPEAFEIEQPTGEKKGNYIDPEEKDLDRTEFNAVWNEIKSWDINVSEEYVGYCGATGNHVMAILNAIERAGLEFKPLKINKFQPKQQHRFVLYIDGIPSWMIKAVDLPKQLKFKEGKLTTNELHTMVLYDPIAPSGTQAVVDWLESKKTKDVKISEIGPLGDQIGQWTYLGVDIDSAEFDTLDWKKDDVVKIQVQFRFEEAKYEKTDN